MPTWMQRSPTIVALAIAAVVLAAVIAVELGIGGLGGALPAPATKRASAAEVKLLPPFAAAVPEQAYPETAARPLFTPTRRPAPEAVAQSAVVRGQFVLLGVTVAGDTRIAMLREKSSGRLHRAEAGKEVNGIKVAQIERESVTLGAGDDREVLTLQVQKPAGAAAQAGAAPVQGPFAAAPAPQQAPAASGGIQSPAAAPQFNPAGTSGAAPPQTFTPPTGQAPMPVPANPSGVQVPQATAPMSPEELLARRRARRTQQTQ